MQGSPLFTSTLARHTQKKMSLQCRGASTSITVGLPIIWWSRRLGHYWGRLENILNSAAFRSQWRHAPSYHDHSIVHCIGWCESLDWLSGCGSLYHSWIWVDAASKSAASIASCRVARRIDTTCLWAAWVHIFRPGVAKMLVRTTSRNDEGPAWCLFKAKAGLHCTGLRCGCLCCGCLRCRYLRCRCLRGGCHCCRHLRRQSLCCGCLCCGCLCCRCLRCQCLGIAISKM